MILVFSKDRFFVESIGHLVADRQVVHISEYSDLQIQPDRSCLVILDAYHNNALDDQMLEKILQLDVRSIFVLAPFQVSKMKCRVPLFFVDRRIKTTELLDIISGRYRCKNCPAIRLSYNQLKIARCIVSQNNEAYISSMLKISVQTLRIQKFNIMLKLKLRRISDIIKLDISPYFLSFMIGYFCYITLPGH